jgi:hypothetical protein
MKNAAILGVCVLWAAAARADGRAFGAVAPAVIPAGSTAIWGFTGVPDIGVGFRQGIGPVEVDADASLDYFDLTFCGEVRARIAAIDRNGLSIAPFVGMGIVWDSGSTYEDANNFRYTAVRVHAGGLGSRQLSETVALLGIAELRWDLFTSPSGGHRIEPLFGGGAEFGLAENVSLFALGELGPDIRALPSGASDTELGYTLRFGVGFRLF